MRIKTKLFLIVLILAMVLSLSAVAAQDNQTNIKTAQNFSSNVGDDEGSHLASNNDDSVIGGGKTSTVNNK